MLISNVWEHTWQEILDFINQGYAVSAHTGHLIASKDRKLDVTNGWALYIHSVKWAFSSGKAVPPKVLQHFEDDVGNGISVKNEVHLAVLTGKKIPEQKEAPMVLNRKGKPFSWSYSAINDWETCQEKYAGSRFYCTSPFVESEAMRWGNVVHKALEDRINKGTPLPKDLEHLEKYPAAMLAAGGKVVAEKDFAVTRDWKPTSWFAKDAWGRCKIDVHIDLGDKAAIYDYKSGGIPKFEKDLQLDISALFLSLILPKAEVFIPKFIYTAHNQVTPKDKIIQKGDLPAIKTKLEATIAEMEEAWATESFSCKPSGLCRKHCEVFECEHNGRRG